jgi:hypothetical protein
MARYVFHGDGSLTTCAVHYRWPGKVPAGAVNNEIVHIVDLYPTLARVGGAEVPKDRPIDGVDQLDFFWANMSTPTAKDFLPTSLTGCLRSNGETGRYTLSGR